jgi:ABC-type Fe3+-hydroxamate transport system substrate-binding protein
MKQYKDQLDRTFQLSATPKRIISLVPSLTELLCDLGLETKLVGVTKFCVHPKHLRTKHTVVGGTKKVHFDKIEELQPDIIICNKEENTPEMIQVLEQFAPVHISNINNIEDCLEIIDMYGNLFEIQNKAQTVISKIRIKQNDFKLYINALPKHSVAYFIWKDPWMAVGSNTFIDCLLRANNFRNVFENLSRYPEIVMGKSYIDVELVLLSSEPYPFNESHISTLKPLFPNAKILLVNGEMFSWYGSRLIKAFDYFNKLHEQLNNT